MQVFFDGELVQNLSCVALPVANEDFTLSLGLVTPMARVSGITCLPGHTASHCTGSVEEFSGALRGVRVWDQVCCATSCAKR